MAARRAGSDEVGQRYAAHRLELVRLAVVLGREPAQADALVQRVFLDVLRGGDRSHDPGAGLAALRTLVVRACRTAPVHRVARTPVPAHAGAPAGPPDRLERLSTTQREVVALVLWTGLSTRQAALVLGTTERAVLTALDHALDRAQATSEQVDELLRRRADAVSGVHLRGSWSELVQQDARLTARTRGRWRAVGAVAAATAGVVAAATLVGGRSADLPTPTPVPTATATESVSSPAVGPDEQPRSAIPWDDVGPGWSIVASASPPTAITTTVLLVSPTGTRYPVGTAPDSIVLQDVSADGRRALLAVGTQASEWDLVAGTSRPITVSSGWKSMRYAGAPDRGYLVLWTDSDSAVQLDHWNTNGRLLAAYPITLPPTAGSPGSPGVVVDPSGRTAFVATREGGVSTIDLDRDSVGALPLPDGLSGCAPRRSWTATEVLLACSSGGGRLVVTGLTGSGARILGPSGLSDAWPLPPDAAAVPGSPSSPGALVTAVVQRNEGCSTATGRLDASGSVVALGPTGQAAFLVPNSVVAGVLVLGGTRCWADGSSLVAYDVASGSETLLAGETAGRRTVRQAVVLQGVIAAGG